MGLITKLLPNSPVLSKIYRLVKTTFLFLFISHLVYTILLIKIPVFTTPTIIGQWLSGKTIYKDWVSEEAIAESIRRAVIASEDQEFDEHFGFDIEQIEKAMKYNQTHKKKRVLVRFHSKSLKMYFYGKEGLGCAKALKFIVHY